MNHQPFIAPFVYQGKTITFTNISGTVLSSERSVQTDYQLSGGGGRMSASGGYISTPQLHSSTTERQDLWIRTSDGRDVRFDLSGFVAPVLVGQSVSMVVGETEGSFRNVPTMLINWGSSEHHELLGVSGLLALIDPPDRNPRVWLVWIVGLAVAFGCFVLYLLFDGHNALQAWFGIAILATPFVSMFYVAFRRVGFNGRFTAARERLRRHLDEETSRIRMK